MSTQRFPSPTRARLPVVLAALVAVASVAAAGCDRDEPRAGAITVSQTSEPERLDPAYAYSGDSGRPLGANEALSLVYTPLLAYRHEEGAAGAELIPGLAQDLPEVSEDGKTYSLTLREELEYSNGDAVRPGDFEHTIKRVLNAGSPAARFFENIAGASAYLRAPEATADIPGIETDESGEITIRLAAPDASFPYALAMWFAGLVPQSTRFRDRSADPPPGVGPYEIAAAQPGRRVVLSRSETFGELAIPDIPTGNVERITLEVASDVERQAEAVLDNELDYMRDSPPPEVKSTLLSEDDRRYREQTAAATYLFFLDPSRPPFDRAWVREAANLAVDRPALARAFDGEIEPGCSFLPPGVPGYDEELDVEDCPYGDPTEPPDLGRAERLVEAAGASGTEVTVWGSTDEGIAAATVELVRALRSIGLDAQPRLIGHDAYLARLERGEPLGAAGFASAFPEFPHPARAFTRVAEAEIPGASAPRLPVADDPALREAIADAQLEPGLEPDAERWEEIDRYLVSPPQSYVIAFGHPKLSTFVSNRLDLDRIKFHPVYLNDYSTFALREEADGYGDRRR